jgi:hypothetical protein
MSTGGAAGRVVRNAFTSRQHIIIACIIAEQPAVRKSLPHAPYMLNVRQRTAFHLNISPVPTIF